MGRRLRAEGAVTVSWSDFEIERPPVAGPDKVGEAERALGVKLPADFLAVATIHQGALPEPSSFDIPDSTSSAINYLLHFEAEPFTSNIVARREPVVDVMPDKVVPFAADGGGNLLCFDYRADPAHPSVVFWDHESEDKDQVQLVARSFTDLLAKLYA